LAARGFERILSTGLLDLSYIIADGTYFIPDTACFVLDVPFFILARAYIMSGIRV